MTACSHVETIDVDLDPSADGCEDCLAAGGSWVHLRMCQQCGHVACCDSSPNRHASAHHRGTGHPLVRSFEPGESWFWCFQDQVGFELEGLPPGPSHSG